MSPSPHPPFRPDFLVLGAQKAATSSLARALDTHPDIFIPAAKEAHHFGRVPDAEAGGPAYARFFAAWSGERLVGEATPNYLADADARRQILRTLPTARMVVSLRHPVERAYSAYWHGRRAGRLRGSFEDVLDAERAGPPWRPFGDLVTIGRYAESLHAYLDEGLDRDRLHVVLFEDLTYDPAPTLAGIQRFLGVEPLVEDLPELNTVRRSVLPRVLRGPLFSARRRSRTAARVLQRTYIPFTPPPMRPDTRRRLLDAFAESNAAVERLLGRDLSAWNR